MHFKHANIWQKIYKRILKTLYKSTRGIISTTWSNSATRCRYENLVRQSYYINHLADQTQRHDAVMTICHIWANAAHYSQQRSQKHSLNRYYASFTETGMLSFWRNFHHWLHWKLSQDNFQCSKWWKFQFRQNDDIFVSVLRWGFPINLSCTNRQRSSWWLQMPWRRTCARSSATPVGTRLWIQCKSVTWNII